MHSSARYYTMDRRRISFVKFILEAYDNVAVLSTLDPASGLVRITIAPGCDGLVAGVLNDLATTCGIQAAPRPPEGRTARLNRRDPD